MAFGHVSFGAKPHNGDMTVSLRLAYCRDFKEYFLLKISLSVIAGTENSDRRNSHQKTVCMEL